MKLTVARTEGLKLPAGKTDHIVFDDDIPGFGLRLRTGGGRWIFQYMIGQRQRRMTFGNFSTLDAANARTQAEMLHAAVKLGRDPVAEKNESRARSGETFEACMRLYLGRRRGDPKLIYDQALGTGRDDFGEHALEQVGDIICAGLDEQSGRRGKHGEEG